MVEIPLQPVPSQILRVILGGQNFQIYVYAKTQGVFVDVAVGTENVSTGVIARDTVPLIPQTYTSVAGTIMFIDTQGASDPDYREMGSRWRLIYLTEDEYAQL